MSDYFATGESGFKGHDAQSTVVNTHVQDGRSRYYEVPYAKSGGGLDDDSFRSSDREESKHSQAKERLLTASRYNIARWSKGAMEAATRLAAANEEGDFMEARSAGNLLLDSLARLWRFRDVRESEFAEVVNMLQIALAKTEFEVLPLNGCRGIRDTIDECLLSGAVDDTQVRHAKSLLRKAGLDPYRGLSLREE